MDKFQGQEAPVVIYSCTSSSPEDAPRGMAFLYDPHRFNVATSRAQGVVIVVASPRLFEPECRTPEQMRWANGLCKSSATTGAPTILTVRGKRVILDSEHAIEVSVYDAICRYGYRPISELNCRYERENPLHG